MDGSGLTTSACSKDSCLPFSRSFIELFLPDVMAYLEPDSLTFLDKEVFTDVVEFPEFRVARTLKGTKST